MKPEAQRVAIAEACGHYVVDIPFSPASVKPGDKTVFTAAAAKEWEKAYPTGRSVKQLPDFLADLNAMHEAEKTLTYLPNYLFHLREVCGPFPDAECEWNDIWWSDVVRATAAQRAEAFLRTMNLWKD